jgi:hypothetical protein
MICGLFTAHVLYHTAQMFINELLPRQMKTKDFYAIGSLALALRGSDLVFHRLCGIYISLQHISISCVGQTTTVFAKFPLVFTF